LDSGSHCIAPTLKSLRPLAYFLPTSSLDRFWVRELIVWTIIQTDESYCGQPSRHQERQADGEDTERVDLPWLSAFTSRFVA
jgi:hypothetical protein